MSTFGQSFQPPSGSTFGQSFQPPSGSGFGQSFQPSIQQPSQSYVEYSRNGLTGEEKVKAIHDLYGIDKATETGDEYMIRTVPPIQAMIIPEERKRRDELSRIFGKEKASETDTEYDQRFRKYASKFYQRFPSTNFQQLSKDDKMRVLQEVYGSEPAHETQDEYEIRMANKGKKGNNFQAVRRQNNDWIFGDKIASELESDYEERMKKAGLKPLYLTGNERIEALRSLFGNQKASETDTGYGVRMAERGGLAVPAILTNSSPAKRKLLNRLFGEHRASSDYPFSDPRPELQQSSPIFNQPPPVSSQPPLSSFFTQPPPLSSQPPPSPFFNQPPPVSNQPPPSPFPTQPPSLSFPSSLMLSFQPSPPSKITFSNFFLFIGDEDQEEYGDEDGGRVKFIMYLDNGRYSSISRDKDGHFYTFKDDKSAKDMLQNSLPGEESLIPLPPFTIKRDHSRPLFLVLSRENRYGVMIYQQKKNFELVEITPRNFEANRLESSMTMYSDSIPIFGIRDMLPVKDCIKDRFKFRINQSKERKDNKSLTPEDYDALHDWRY